MTLGFVTGTCSSGADGRRPTLVLIHGDLVGPEVTWRAQQSLRGAFALTMVCRRGYAPGDLLVAQDPERDAADVDRLLSAGPGAAHLVGHSYGAVVAALAAVATPGAVGSLVLIEPPAFGLVDDPATAAHMAAIHRLCERARDAEAFFDAFRATLGKRGPPVRRLTAAQRQAVACMRAGRWPWEVAFPSAELAALDIPIVVVTGGHDRKFELVADHLVTRLGCRHLVVRGAGHDPQLLPSFNELLLEMHAVPAVDPAAGVRHDALDVPCANVP